MPKQEPQILFSDHFQVSKELLEKYGAFNISLVTDLPLFIDPFLLFNSEVPVYRHLHDGIIRYLRFLKDRSLSQTVDTGLLNEWYKFKEVKQNWLGFSADGNRGRGLGKDFAIALNKNLYSVFSNFGEEQITEGSHLERLCLIKDGVGRDNISDFTTNLIKEFLLGYTQIFATQHIEKRFCKSFVINKVRFNYETESWERKQFYLPCFKNDFVLLTPKNILTKDENWINKKDLISDFEKIPDAIPDDHLRSQINNYFRSILPKNPKEKDERDAASLTIQKFPVLIDYFIKIKEEDGDEAENISTQKVKYSEKLYLQQFRHLATLLAEQTNFYNLHGNTYLESKERIEYLKHVIEDNDGYRIFYVDGVPIKREEDAQILFRLTWFGSLSDVSPEANSGRGPVDYKISRGAKDKTLVEFKLAGNTKLKRNLQNQLDIYKKGHDTERGIYVIIYFSEGELVKVQNILRELKLEADEDIILIDARRDNKVSASKA